MVAKMRDVGKNSWRVWDGPVHSAVIRMVSQGWPARTCCIAGTLLSVVWWPGWEGSLREKGCLCMYGWVPSLFT